MLKQSMLAIAWLACASLAPAQDLAVRGGVVHTVSGESITFSTHTVVVTVVDAVEPRLATFTTTGGDIAVKIWDLNSGNVAVQDNFSIVIYNANPVVVNRVGVPDGIDADKYTEAPGAVLVETRNRVEPVAELDTQGLLLDE